MSMELCEFCDQETGKAGRYEDSLYLWDKKLKREVGPLCESCYQESLESGRYENCE